MHHADVLNGISVSADPDLLYITGKYWDRMFLVRYVALANVQRCCIQSAHLLNVLRLTY
jgi:Glutamine cyclotransferase